MRSINCIDSFVAGSVLIVFVALYLPSLEGIRGNYRELSCMSNERVLGFAMLEYPGIDRGWYAPPVTQGWHKNANRLSVANTTWIHRLQKEGLVRTVSSSTVTLPEGSLDDSLSPPHFRKTLLQTQRCPGVEAFGGSGGQQVWGYNPSIRLLGMMPAQDSADHELRDRHDMLHEGEVSSPRDTVLLAEVFRGMPTWYPFYDHKSGLGMESSGWGWDIRHDQGTNLFFIDGHVERLEFKTVPKKTWPGLWFDKIPPEDRPARYDSLITSKNSQFD